MATIATVYGISGPSAGITLLGTGVMTDFSVTTSGTEQTLPGQLSSDTNADSGVSDVSTKISLTMRGAAVSGASMATIVGGAAITVTLTSEVPAGSIRVAAPYTFSVIVTSVAVTAKARDWWDVKLDGIVKW